MTQVEASSGGFRYVWPLLFVLLFLSVFIFEAVSVYFLADDPWQRLLLTIKRCYWSFWKSVLISPWFYLGVPVQILVDSRHKVPVFWEFHSVHHSQIKMNPFTNERVHPLDWFTANIIRFLPAFFFSDALNVGLAYIIIHKFLDRLNHSNVRTNLGWFRYVFVTPQSHRVHHSNRKEHYDKNFGVSLSIWDHLFGTQHRDYNIYPDTGIPDSRFPKESSTDGTVFKIIRIYLRQMIYPFNVVWNKTLRRS